MSKKITDKIKEILTPEDLKIFEAALEQMVDEKVALKEEAIKTKYDTIAEEYVQKKVAEKLEEEKAKLVEDYDTKLNNLEKKIVTKLDSFLDHVIVEQVSDEALAKIAINEVASPIVEAIKNIYTENYIAIDSNGDKKVKDLEKKVKETEKNLSESLAKVMETEERLEKTATYLLISEKVEGMTKTQKGQVTKMLKDKSFDEVKEKIDTLIEMVKKDGKKLDEKTEEKKVIDSVLPNEDVIEEDKKIVPDNDKTESTFADYANRYL